MSARKRKSDAASDANKSKGAKEDSAGAAGASNEQKRGPFAGRYNHKLGGRNADPSADTAMPHQTWARIVMFCSIAIVAYYTAVNNNNNATKSATMAKQSELIPDKRFQNLVCAPSFKKDIQDLGNVNCLPSKCGRVVMDNVVSDAEAHGLLELAKRGLAMGGSDGGASILDLHSGALSKGDKFVDVYKVHPELFTKKDFELYKRVMGNVRTAVSAHFGVSDLYLSHPTFFSRINSVPAKTLHDEYWHVHTDKETYPNFHYTSLLYLTDFGVDFAGGRFVFVDAAEDKINRTVEPRLGRMSAFTSGVENKHHVEMVTEGTRYALTMGFSCDKSKEIADPGSHLD